MAKLYRIKLKTKDLYSVGGGHPYMTRYGKFWNSLSNLKRHFSLIKNKNKKDPNGKKYYSMYEGNFLYYDMLLIEEYGLNTSETYEICPDNIEKFILLKELTS